MTATELPPGAATRTLNAVRIGVAPLDRARAAASWDGFAYLLFVTVTILALLTFQRLRRHLGRGRP